MKAYVGWTVVAIWIFYIITCACTFNPLSATPPVISPSDNLDARIIEGWSTAQQQLIRSLPDIAGDPLTINPTDFVWELKKGMFRCGDTSSTAGCFFWYRRHIQVWLERPGAVMHESKHAILFDLGDPRWRCYEHPKEQPCTN